MNDRVTRQLASYAAGLRFKDLPREVIAHAKVAVLNIVAAAIGGARTRIGRIHAKLAKDFGGGISESTLIGGGGKVSRAAAAYANGNLAFALDYEDVCHYVIHAGPIVVPAALAIGESIGASGRQFLTAVVAGYESGTRIGLSMQPTAERGAQVWGQQYTPFAACAAVGNLLGLRAEAMDAAFGVTGTYATVPSAYKYFGIVAETRPMREAKLGWGWMSMAGTMGALSAQAGLRGGHGILDGQEGFWIMGGSDRVDHSQIVKDLGTTWLLLDTDFKLHPSIAWNHPPYVALCKLIAEHDVRAKDVVNVRVRNVGVNRIADYAPRSAVDAQFSLPYCIATTLLREPVSARLYDEKLIASRRVRSLLAKIECVADEQMELDWFQRNQMRTHIAITLTDGRTLEQTVTFPQDKPRYGKPDAIQKLRTMADYRFNEARIARIVDTIERLDKLTDIRDLMKLLA